MGWVKVDGENFVYRFDPKESHVVCCRCYGTIVQVQKVWTHVAKLDEGRYHEAMPAPAGVKPVTLKFSSRIRTTVQDFATFVRKMGLSWVGPHTIRGSGDDWIIEITVASSDGAAVIAEAAAQGLFTGTVARAERVRPVTSESDQEGGNEMAGKKKATKKAAGTTKSRSKEEYRQDPNYRECNNCGHFVLKTKWDRHIEKHPACKDQSGANKKAKAAKKAKAEKKPKAKKAKAEKKEAAV